MLERLLVCLALVVTMFAGCSPAPEDTDLAPRSSRAASTPVPATTRSSGVATADQKPPYQISAQGGLPASGPGARYNHCERIWCMPHGENYFVDHFLKAHQGWILHDTAAGDVFVPKYREGGPSFPGARAYVLRLCGDHLHPHILGSGPVKAGMYTVSVGYSRGHFRQFGTSLDTCCLNGLGWDYIHSTGGRYFRFHDLDDYRAHPERGWQKPFSNDTPR